MDVLINDTIVSFFLQDCLLMFMHHVATVSLIMLSYVNNMARVGTLVLCLHDASDVLLEVRFSNVYAIQRSVAGFCNPVCYHNQ